MEALKREKGFWRKAAIHGRPEKRTGSPVREINPHGSPRFLLYNEHVLAELYHLMSCKGSFGEDNA